MSIFDPITNAISAVGAAVTQPVKDVMLRKEERKQAHQTLQTQARIAEHQDETTVEVKRMDLEAALAPTLAGTWKDDFVTYSVVGIIPSFILGGVLEGFGHPEFLNGVIRGVQSMVDMGFQIGYLLTAVACAAVGISLKNRFL